jgi:hypothetical protein
LGAALPEPVPVARVDDCCDRCDQEVVIDFDDAGKVNKVRSVERLQTLV